MYLPSHDDSTAKIIECRNRAVGIRIQLTDARDELGHAKTVCVTRVTTEAGGAKGLGANEKERDQRLDAELLADNTYSRAFTKVRTLEAELEATEAALQNAIDTRRTHEWAIRADAIEACRGVVDHVDPAEKNDQDLDNLVWPSPELVRTGAALPF